MIFRPIGAVTARVVADLYRERAERIDRAADNLRDFIDASNDRIRDLETRQAGVRPPKPTEGIPMSDQSIAERFKDLVVANLGCDPAKITPEANFTEDLGADSLDTIELTMAVEEEFNMFFDDDDLAHVVTVGEAVRLIETSLGRKNGTAA